MIKEMACTYGAVGFFTAVTTGSSQIFWGKVL